MWPVREKPVSSGSSCMRPLEFRWQQQKAASSADGRQHGGGIHSPWSSTYLASEMTGIRSSACRKQTEPQLQQKGAACSVGLDKNQGKLGRKPQVREKKVASEFSCLGKEYGRTIREALQEFAMILTKEYHYNFPIEYFDDYQGSFNKEEFLKLEQPKEKSKWLESGSLLTSEGAQKKCSYVEKEGDVAEVEKATVEAIFSEDGLQPKGYCMSNQQIKGASMTVDQVVQAADEESVGEARSFTVTGKSATFTEHFGPDETEESKNEDESIAHHVASVGKVERLKNVGADKEEKEDSEERIATYFAHGCGKEECNKLKQEGEALGGNAPASNEQAGCGVIISTKKGVGGPCTEESADSTDRTFNNFSDQLQQNKILEVMRKNLVKRSMERPNEIAENKKDYSKFPNTTFKRERSNEIAENKEDYSKFPNTFMKSLKLGVHEGSQHRVKRTGDEQEIKHNKVMRKKPRRSKNERRLNRMERVGIG